MCREERKKNYWRCSRVSMCHTFCNCFIVIYDWWWWWQRRRWRWHLWSSSRLSVSVLVFACTSKPHISNVLLRYRADYLAHESQLHSLVSITRKYIFYLQINLLMWILNLYQHFLLRPFWTLQQAWKKMSREVQESEKIKTQQKYKMRLFRQNK